MSGESIAVGLNTGFIAMGVVAIAFWILALLSRR